MPTFYQEIVAQQRPFPFDTDDNGRTMYSCNFICSASGPVAAFEEDIIKILAAAGVATQYDYTTGVGDTFIGPHAITPVGDGPWIHVIGTSGLMSERTHNGTVCERPACQIITRAASPVAARSRALAIWRVLDAVRNTTVA